jgi:hypothetical protein
MEVVMLVNITDTIFGIYVSVKLNGISTFKSHKLFLVIKTFFCYEPVFGFGWVTYFGGVHFWYIIFLAAKTTV